MFIYIDIKQKIQSPSGSNSGAVCLVYTLYKYRKSRLVVQLVSQSSLGYFQHTIQKRTAPFSLFVYNVDKTIFSSSHGKPIIQGR